MWLQHCLTEWDSNITAHTQAHTHCPNYTPILEARSWCSEWLKWHASECVTWVLLYLKSGQWGSDWVLTGLQKSLSIMLRNDSAEAAPEVAIYHQCRSVRWLRWRRVKLEAWRAGRKVRLTGRCRQTGDMSAVKIRINTPNTSQCEAECTCDKHWLTNTYAQTWSTYHKR